MSQAKLYYLFLIVCAGGALLMLWLITVLIEQVAKWIGRTIRNLFRPKPVTFVKHRPLTPQPRTLPPVDVEANREEFPIGTAPPRKRTVADRGYELGYDGAAWRVPDDLKNKPVKLSTYEAGYWNGREARHKAIAAGQSVPGLLATRDFDHFVEQQNEWVDFEPTPTSEQPPGEVEEQSPLDNPDNVEQILDVMGVGDYNKAIEQMQAIEEADSEYEKLAAHVREQRQIRRLRKKAKAHRKST